MAIYSLLCVGSAALFLFSLFVWKLRLCYNEKVLQKSALRSRFTWKHIINFIRYDIKTFSSVFIGNRVFGRLTMGFLIANIPISSYFAVSSLLTGASKSTFMLLAYPVHELFFSIGFHLYIAKFNKRLHESSKVLLSLLVAKAHRVGDFRSRLKVHFNIARLHTKRKYGITYGSIGLITMKTFAKV